MRTVLALAFLALVLAGPPATAAPKAEIHDDSFSPVATIEGPLGSVNPFGGTFRMWRLRSFVDKKSHAVLHQLYVSTSYFSYWRHWNQAADDHANLYPVTAISRTRERCAQRPCVYDESVGVTLDDAFVRAHRDGFVLKLTAQSGDALFITVAGKQVAPVLDAVDAYAAPAN